MRMSLVVVINHSYKAEQARDARKSCSNADPCLERNLAPKGISPFGTGRFRNIRLPGGEDVTLAVNLSELWIEEYTMTQHDNDMHGKGRMLMPATLSHPVGNSVKDVSAAYRVCTVGKIGRQPSLAVLAN